MKISNTRFPYFKSTLWSHSSDRDCSSWVKNIITRYPRSSIKIYSITESLSRERKCGRCRGNTIRHTCGGKVLYNLSCRTTWKHIIKIWTICSSWYFSCWGSGWVCESEWILYQSKEWYTCYENNAGEVNSFHKNESDEKIYWITDSSHGGGSAVTELS